MLGAMKSHPLQLLVLAVVAVLASTASAQVRYVNPPIGAVPRAPTGVFVNPNPVVGPNGLTLSQYSYNTTVLGRVYGNFYRNIPPYALGYNPYPQIVNNAMHADDQLRSCLLVAGWPLSRVKATQDSMWNAELPTHRRELQTCIAKRDFNLSSCLTLYYKWDSERALATADSVTRARLAR